VLFDVPLTDERERLSPDDLGRAVSGIMGRAFEDTYDVVGVFILI